MSKKTPLKSQLRMIRLVVQLNDTKHNRNVMDKLQDAARLSAVESPHASIKREDVTIVALLTTTPSTPEKKGGA